MAEGPALACWLVRATHVTVRTRAGRLEIMDQSSLWGKRICYQGDAMAVPLSLATPRFPIVVCVDGGAADLPAVEFALRRARSRHLPLRLVHIDDEQRSTHTPVDVAQCALETQTSLQVLTAALEIWLGERRRRQTPRRRRRVPMPLAAASEAAESLVVGLRPEVSFPWISRATAGYRLEGVRCPTLCIPSGWSVADEHLPVVVSISRSREARRLLALGLEEAGLRRSAVIALYAWHPSDRTYASGRSREAAIATAAVERDLTEIIAAAQPGYPEVPVHLEIRCEDARSALVHTVGTASLLIVGEQRWALPSASCLKLDPGSSLRTAICPIELMPMTAAHDHPGHARDKQVGVSGCLTD